MATNSPRSDADRADARGPGARDVAGDAPPRADAVTLALRAPGTAQRILTGTVAWTVTVLPVAFSSVGKAPARVLAGLALIAALSGPALSVKKRRIGRHLGITVFLALATGIWLLTPQAIEPERIDSVRAAIGALAWGVFALSWGEPWTAFGAPEKKADVDPMVAPLRARATLAPFAVPVATFGVVAAVILLVGVWQIHEHSRALIAEAVGVALAVALVSSSATIAVSRGKSRSDRDRKINASVVRALLLLALVAILGAVALAFRS